MSIQSTLEKPRPTTRPEPRPLDRAVARSSQWLNQHSIDILRVSLGLVFLVFGAIKFVPGASPAEDLVIRTIDALTLGIVSGQSAVVLTAITECVIGITLVTGRFLRVGLVVLGGALVGIMSPLVLFFGDLVADGITLDAQYVFKDIVLAAAGLVIAARALGAKLTPSDDTARR